MKKILASVVFIISTHSVILAQNQPPQVPTTSGQEKPQPKKEMLPPDQHAKKKAEHMAKDLKLSAEQQSKVNAALFNFYSKKEILQSKKSTIKKEDFRKEAKDLEMERDNALKNILTAEQYQEYLKKEAERKNKLPNGGGPNDQHHD